MFADKTEAGTFGEVTLEDRSGIDIVSGPGPVILLDMGGQLFEFLSEQIMIILLALGVASDAGA